MHITLSSIAWRKALSFALFLQLMLPFSLAFAVGPTTSAATKHTLAVNNSATSLNAIKGPIGINLSPFSYYSSTVPFKDLMMQSGGPAVVKRVGGTVPCPEQPNLDQAGYPISLPNGCEIRFWIAFHILEDSFWPSGTLPYQPGHYVLLYQGSGKISLSWDAQNVVYKQDGRIEFDVPTPHAGIQLEITAMALNNPIRDMHIVNANDEATYTAQPFNETWLGLLKPFKLLRFVEWGQLLGIYPFTIRRLSPNTAPDYYFAEFRACTG